MKKKITLIILILLFGTLCFLFGKDFNKIENRTDFFVEQGYSFKIPQNWKQTDELGTVAFLNEQEENGDNPFKSYIFFLKDDLEGRSEEQYFDYIKTQVKNSSQDAEILEEKNEDSFHIIVMKTVQSDNNYVVGTAFKKGLNNTYWVISLNSLESNWQNVKPIFEETIKSFELR